MDMSLYFAPDTCARVTMIALEETGHPYDTKLIAFMRGDHKGTDFLSVNSKGKVPALVVDGVTLTENVAIIYWLSKRFPEAKLLPVVADSFEQSKILADLAFCASGLHPIVTRLRIPQYFCDAPDATARVFEMAEAAMRPNFELINSRLEDNKWWYGDTWSAVDAYVNWIWFRVAGTSFDVTHFPNIARHDDAMLQRPAVERALKRNAEATAELVASGLAISFSGKGAIEAASR